MKTSSCGFFLLFVLAACSPTPAGMPDGGGMMGSDAASGGGDASSAPGLTGTWVGTAMDVGTITSTFGGASANAVMTTGVFPLRTLGTGCQNRIVANGTFTLMNNYLMLSYTSGTRETTGCMDASLNVASAPAAASDLGLADYSNTIMINNNMFTAMIGSATYTFTKQ